MQNDKILDKKYLSKFLKDVSEICNPLCDLNITYFLYSCLFDDGSIYFLNTNPDLCQNHFEKRYPIVPQIPSQLIKNKFYYLPTPGRHDVKFSNAIYDSRLHQVDHQIFFMERNSDHYEIVIFGTFPENDQIINSYLNNLEFLEKFKFFFKDKARNLISICQKNKLLLPKSMLLPVDKINKILSLKKEDNLNNTINPNYYFFKYKNKEIKITKREMDCIELLVKGKSAKEIGHLLDISYRTVESYVSNIKNKLNCNRKSEIINIINRLKTF